MGQIGPAEKKTTGGGDFPPPQAPPELAITPAFMYDLYQAGVVGTKEFRNFLAKIDPRFAEIRDPDVDNQIDEEARRRYQLFTPADDGVVIDRDGQLKGDE